jgi:acetyl esterase
VTDYQREVQRGKAARGTRGLWPAAISLSWAALGLLWAQAVLLQHPVLPPPFLVGLLDVPATTRAPRFVVMLARETSLLLLAFALAGIVPAFLAHRAGHRRTALVGTAACAFAAVASLVPVGQALWTASAEDAPLSLSGYLAGTSYVEARPSETVTYARPGGEELELDVWRPSGEAAGGPGRPAVIVVHGGAWERGSRGQMPRWNAWFADRGYAVFDIEYRLAPPPRWREAPADVRCAVGWVKQNAARYGVDPDRVALVGHSAGGHLALLSAYTEGGRAAPASCDVPDTEVEAVAAFYPPTDLAGLYRRGYLGGMPDFMGGIRADVPERYRLTSPVARVDAGDPATFLVHGSGDEIVPAAQSGLLAERLRGAGVPNHYLELPWASHTFDFYWGGWGAQITRSSLGEFLNNHLETPDRTDAARDGETKRSRAPKVRPTPGLRFADR